MKLLVLGASNAQLPGILKAKAMGHQVITLDYLTHAIGHQYSDGQCYDSTFDSQKVIECAAQHQVEGIMTLGTDQPVLSAMLASKALALPAALTCETALKVTNKIAMKKMFVKHQIPTAHYVIYEKGVNEHDLRTLTYPVVVKPVDSQGQRGIFYLETVQEVIDHYASVIIHSRQKEILVETYYPHDEITVSGWVVNGQCTLLTVTDRITFSSKRQLGVCLAHRFPSKHSSRYGDAIHKLTHQIVHTFNIENGPIYFQYLLGEEGIKVNEIACRIGGAHEAVFIPKVTGFDIVKAQIALALGKQYPQEILNTYDVRKNPYHVSVQLFFVKPTTIVGLTDIHQLKAIPGVIDVGYHVEIGDTITSIENATQRAGYAVIIGTSSAKVHQTLTRFYQLLKITDAKGENHVIHSPL